ncbi:N-6 DNA methylase [Sebaldella sp. S0638]|uniref:N-6 DNA methylase n=1 Tax=Sebaldella sp. S0638 TaxID=2957809 RepID=UPI00209FC4EB|nr:N-6 DNA methylase [Sebaldella sp. S0638]MCP1226480.1 N-6 DNA methylase [Sebaldella sp. S0638]
MKLNDILKNSNYDESIFTEKAKKELETKIVLRQVKSGETPYVECIIRKREIVLKPEEVIRQLYLDILINKYKYPKSRISLESPVHFGREVKKADIVIWDKDRPDVPYIIVEVKKFNLKDGKEQLKSYCNATGAPIGIWTNGKEVVPWHRKDPNYFEEITDLPRANQKLVDVLNERKTYKDLCEIDELKTSKRSLKDIILEIEDEVLANAGVDVFEEVFKLIFSKLYDELTSAQNPNEFLRFWNAGYTDYELREEIGYLFEEAKEKWYGVFSEDSKVTLSPSHLAVCVASLQKYKLFNSNLDVVDDAFEYLMSKSSKGEKGQYFTPRYVIDMCVKMINPKEEEYIIDTAAGSAGFTVHSIFHVWNQIREEMGLEKSPNFTTEKRTQRELKYVESKVFAIDFDEKAVRVARTLNLIAGDGQTNVLHLNTLDYNRWDEISKQESWNDTYNKGFRKLKKLRAPKASDYKNFSFDVLLANPPFAGDIKEQQIITQYELGEKSKDKWKAKVGRDVLFIERNLKFLKPGGRMAIVLPQGRFNNSSDQKIREFIAEHGRILAVVGLHGNTFKPHTGTKTSVLFVQKWDGNLCPRVEDYNIFFATMQKSGKDNSGEKIYVKDENGENRLDTHDHLIVEHDLYNHEGLTEDGIAEAFIEFAKKEELSFF